MNILLVSLGTAGDVHPFVGLGIELRRRGHAVTLMVNEYFKSLADENDLDFVAVGTVAQFEETLKDPAVWRSFDGAKLLGRMICEAAPAQYHAVLSRYVPGATVILSSGSGFGARIAHEVLGVPLATILLQPGVLRSAYRMPIVPGLPRIPDWVPREAKRACFRVLDTIADRIFLVDRLNAFRAELGLEPVRRLLDNWWLSPQLVIAMFPEWFGPRQPDWPRRLCITGFPLYDGRSRAQDLPPEVEAFLQDGSPPIVFTPGSGNAQAQRFFDAGIEACGLLGRRGLLLTRFADQLPRRLPPHVQHFSFIPFRRLLPRAAVLVHHGGVGTMSQAMAAGIPQLIMPLAYDQPDNADRVKRLGVGDRLAPSAFHPQAVAHKLRKLLAADDVSARCQRLAERIREYDSLEKSCNLIEDWMETTLGAVGEGARVSRRKSAC